MKYDPSNLLDQIRLQQSPDATEKETFNAFVSRVENERGYLLPIIMHWFKEHYKRSTVVAVSAGEYEIRPAVEEPSRPLPAQSCTVDVVTAPAPRPRVAPISPEQRERDKKIIDDWKEQIRFALTMTFVMPNGDQLRHCSAGYVRQCGGVFTALVKGLPDNVLVGPNRTNDDLQNICKRYKMELA